MFPLRLFGASALALSLALPTIPAFAAMAPGFADGITAITAGSDTLLIDVKQGRSGTGERGRDRDRDDDDDDHDDDRGRGFGSDDSGIDDNGIDDNGSYDNDDGSGSGRDRPRIPGGSGCDDPEDLIEHPECLL